MKRKQRTMDERIEVLYADLVKAGQGEWSDLPNGDRVFLFAPLPDDPKQAMEVFREFSRIELKHFPKLEDWEKYRGKVGGTSAITLKEFN